MMFLQSTPSLKASYDFNVLSENALNTYVLGEHVGPKWGLPKVMKWRPAAVGPTEGAENLGSELARSVGLYKVTGTTVEATVGGVFHQFVRFHDIHLLVRGCMSGLTFYP